MSCFIGRKNVNAEITKGTVTWNRRNEKDIQQKVNMFLEHPLFNEACRQQDEAVRTRATERRPKIDMLQNWTFILPKNRINDFKKEVEYCKVEKESLFELFKIPSHIKNIKEGNPLYIVCDNQIHGYFPCIHEIVNKFNAMFFCEKALKPFICETMGNQQQAGIYAVCCLLDYREVCSKERKSFQSIRSVPIEVLYKGG